MSWLDGVFAAVLAAATFAVHNVHYLLTTSYWTDESWVVVPTRFPLGDLPRLTSTTPIGWSFLIRLVPAGGAQRARLVPLAIGVLAVVAAYWFARGLPWRSRGHATAAGVLGGTSVLLAPSMLVRDDLKQYTADAFVALLVVGCAARLEQAWTRRRLAALVLVIVIGMLVSVAAAFVGVAAFVAVVAMVIARRDRAQLIEVVIAGAIAAALGAVDAWIYSRAVDTGLTAYWQPFYIAHDGGGLRFAGRSIARTAGALGLGPAWLAGLLIAAGLVTLVRIGRPVVVVTTLLLWLEMVILAAADKYPFLDARTSTFLTVLAEVLAAIGIVGLCSLLTGRLNWLAVAICVIAAAGYVGSVHSFIDSRPIPAENIRAQVDYVAAHRRPADVVLVNLSSNWGFGYYWKANAPGYRRNSAVTQQYVVGYPAGEGIVTASDRTPAAVTQALADAIGLATARHGRIWLIRTHVNTAEAAAWTDALAADGQQPVLVGADHLTLLNP